CEHTVWLGNTGRGYDQRWIPAVDPICFSHRAKQREYSFRRANEALSVGASGSNWFDDIHVSARVGKWLTPELRGAAKRHPLERIVRSLPALRMNTTSAAASRFIVLSPYCPLTR